MKREIELAKLQLLADQFEASGIISLSNYGNGMRVHMDEEAFYRLFGDRGADEVEVTIGENGAVWIKTCVGDLRYESILLIEEDLND